MSEVQQKELPCFGLFRDELGYVPSLFLAQASVPQLVEAQAALIFNVLFSAGELSRVQRETLALVYAACRQNAYCATFHFRNFRVLGISDEKLRGAFQHRPGNATARRTALLDLAMALAIDTRAALFNAANAALNWSAAAVEEALLSCALSAFVCELSTRIGHAPDFPFITLPPPPHLEPVEESAGAFDVTALGEAISRVVPGVLKAQADQQEESEMRAATRAAVQVFLATAQIKHPDAAFSRQSHKRAKRSGSRSGQLRSAGRFESILSTG